MLAIVGERGLEYKGWLDLCDNSVTEGGISNEPQNFSEISKGIESLSIVVSFSI